MKKNVPAEVVEAIKSRYSSKFRKYVQYYSANIPEVFWGTEGMNAMYVNELLQNTMDSRLTIVQYSEFNRALANISAMMKHLMNRNCVPIREDFFQLCIALEGKYGVSSLIEAVEHYRPYTHLIITQIMSSDLFDKHAEIFTVFVKNVLYDISKTDVVLCFENSDNMEKTYDPVWSRMLEHTNCVLVDSGELE